MIPWWKLFATSLESSVRSALQYDAPYQLGPSTIIANGAEHDTRLRRASFSWLAIRSTAKEEGERKGKGDEGGTSSRKKEVRGRVVGVVRGRDGGRVTNYRLWENCVITSTGDERLPVVHGISTREPPRIATRQNACGSSRDDDRRRRY
jgi:hypothetical protein